LSGACCCDSAYQLCVLCATAVWVLLATFVKPLAD
jgi:hypothetical protein